MVEISSTYQPGSWIGVVRCGTAVLLPPDSDPALVNKVWELLGQTPEAHEVLHAVTNASGLSLANMPSFGIVDFKNSLRVFLRGDIELTARLAAGTVELSGRDVTTWTERRLADAQGFRVALPGGGDGAWHGTPGGELPLGGGVVLLRQLRIENSGPDRVPVPDAGTVTGRTEDRIFAYNEASHETVMAIPDEDFSYTSHESFHAPEEEAVIAEPAAGAPEEAVVTEQAEDAPEEAVVAEQAEDVVAEQAADAPAEEDDVAEQAPEMTSSYDHLWEKTVVRNIEDAAVREDPQAGPGPEDPGPQHPEPEDPEPLELAAGPAVEQSFEPPQQPPTAAADAGSAGSGTVSQDGLIESVPWRTAGLSQNLPWTPPSFASSAAARQQQEPALQGPALQEASLQGPPPVIPSLEDSDHDGETIMKSELGGPAGPVAVASDAATDTSGPTVLARVCQLGHANPPTNSKCSSCGALLPDDAVQVQRPPLGRMRLSSGELIDLDQSLIVGRQPSVSRVQGSVMPKLVQVASPSGDISRSHVEVRLEGWHVMLCDLKATNGTVLVREGQPPRRLAQGEMAILLDGDIAELGDDVSLRFEEIL